MIEMSLFKDLLDKKTCSIKFLKPDCVSYIKDLTYLKYLIDINFPVHILADEKLEFHLADSNDNFLNHKFVKFYFVSNVLYSFSILHNFINRNKPRAKISIGKNGSIHISSVLGAEGLHLAFGLDDSENKIKIQMIHIGNLFIGDNVIIGAHSVIHRGVLDDTIIGNNIYIGALSNIGHNCIIEDNTVIGNGCIISGSVRIGNNCWVGVGTNIKNKVSICDNVIIGMGSNVYKNITESGIYYGTPLKKQKEYIENWNF